MHSVQFPNSVGTKNMNMNMNMNMHKSWMIVTPTPKKTQSRSLYTWAICLDLLCPDTNADDLEKNLHQCSPNATPNVNCNTLRRSTGTASKNGLYKCFLAASRQPPSFLLILVLVI